MNNRIRFTFPLALLVAWAAVAGPSGLFADEPLPYPDRRDIPPWWQQTRAFYCPLANSGAGSSLMKYKTERTKNFEGFHDLVNMLDDAEALGTNVIYLVDYWEPDYEHKSDYRPKLKWGGASAFREGIEKVHERGGKVLVYLEALIIHRDTELGRTRGPKWAMMDEKGRYYPYYGRHQYYLMYPGPGSGWVDYLVQVAGRLARDFKVDGVHLDSYGVHLDHVRPDYNPLHPKGQDAQSFHAGALELVTRLRAELRRYVPEAVVILEGAERTDLLEACDGAQFENIEKLKKKPWFSRRRYPIFTSSFELAEMQEILDAGQNLALSPWWFRAHPGDRDNKWLRAKTDRSSRWRQLEALHVYHNLLEANDLLPDEPADFDRLSDGIVNALNERGWQSEFDYEPLRSVAQRYTSIYEQNKAKLTRTPADAIREINEKARKRRLPQPGDPMPPDIHAEIHRVAEGLRAAMRQRDLDAIKGKAQELREALGDWAGVAERKPRFRAPPDAETRLSDEQIAALWNRAWQDAEGKYGGEGRWGLPGGDHPEVRHSLLRRTAYVVMGGLAALKHSVGDRHLVGRRVDEGLAYLRSVQRPDGVFPFPDARSWSKHFRWLLDAHYELCPECFVDGWVVKDRDDGGLDGGLQFDNGVCAVTMITAFEQLGDRRYRESARRACEWTLTQPIVPNWNYNAFSVWALARYVEVTGDRRFIAPAVERLRLGVLPGQLPGGRWMDPHNARTVYHAIMLRAMTELYAVLPAGEPVRPQLRDAIRRAERVLVDEICTHGATDGDHSLSALCAVERVFGPQARRADAIRIIINAMYRQIVEPRVKCLHDVTLFAVRQVLQRSGRPTPSQPAEP